MNLIKTIPHNGYTIDLHSAEYPNVDFKEYVSVIQKRGFTGSIYKVVSTDLVTCEEDSLALVEAICKRQS